MTETATATTTTKETLITALDRWIRQRPGLDFGNYGDHRSYNAEMRSITKDLQQARTLLRHVSMSSITADDLIHALRHAFSGRLSWNDANGSLNYCTGQYWPTEYRRAVCAVLASALWSHWRTSTSTGDSIRKEAVRTFGRGIADRWFH